MIDSKRGNAAYLCALATGLVPAAKRVLAPVHLDWDERQQLERQDQQLGGTAPTSNAANDLTFNNNVNVSMNQNNAAGFQVNSITFGTSSGSYIVGSNQISFAGASSAINQNDNVTRRLTPRLRL